MENFFIYYQNIFYTAAAICFILGLKRLSHPRTARTGNFIAMLGMFTAIVITVYIGTLKYNIDLYLIIIGIMIGAAIGAVIAIKIEMTSIPQMVAAFNGFGGAASALIAASEFYKWRFNKFNSNIYYAKCNDWGPYFYWKFCSFWKITRTDKWAANSIQRSENI